MTEDASTHWCGEPTGTWREVWGVPAFEAYQCIGSTNDRAKELAGEPGNLFAVVIAEEQTGGRGRRGSTWHSPRGTGLWMSVVLPNPQAALHIPLLVGLAAAEAIQDAQPDLRVGIEWPNDLVIRNRKLGGVLCEGVAGAVVAGLGINLRTPPNGFPDSLKLRATSLEEMGAKALSLSQLAGMILRSLRARLGEPVPHLSPEAHAEIRARDALAARLVLTEEHGQGVARGIEPDGALLLEREDGSRVRVVAGSVRPV